MMHGKLDLLVALLAEGVDRNRSAAQEAGVAGVALLAEGVDRNLCAQARRRTFFVALIAEGVDRNRRYVVLAMMVSSVALLAEGVDRNSFSSAPSSATGQCRPPRGGRG